MLKKEIIEKLTTFKRIDKYIVFKDAVEDIEHTGDDRKKIVEDITDRCCEHLIDILQSSKRPSVITMKKLLSDCMDEIALAEVDDANKEFGYQLCWYMAEKAGIDLRKASERKIWGYWRVQNGEVVTVGSVRKKKKGTKS